MSVAARALYRRLNRTKVVEVVKKTLPKSSILVREEPVKGIETNQKEKSDNQAGKNIEKITPEKISVDNIPAIKEKTLVLKRKPVKKNSESPFGVKKTSTKLHSFFEEKIKKSKEIAEKRALNIKKIKERAKVVAEKPNKVEPLKNQVNEIPSIVSPVGETHLVDFLKKKFPPLNALVNGFYMLVEKNKVIAFFFVFIRTLFIFFSLYTLLFKLISSFFFFFEKVLYLLKKYFFMKKNHESSTLINVRSEVYEFPSLHTTQIIYTFSVIDADGNEFNFLDTTCLDGFLLDFEKIMENHILILKKNNPAIPISFEVGCVLRNEEKEFLVDTSEIVLYHETEGFQGKVPDFFSRVLLQAGSFPRVENISIAFFSIEKLKIEELNALYTLNLEMDPPPF